MLKYDFIVIIPINPTTLAKYRTAFKPSRAKDDPTDAELALDLMLRYPEKFKPLKPQSTNMRKLTYLVEQRRKLVDEKQRAVNQTIDTLKQYFPQAVEWFSKKDSRIFCRFMTRWPTLQHAQRAHKTTLEDFFRNNYICDAEKITKRVNAIKEAMPLTEDEAVIETHSMFMTALLERIICAMKSIKLFDHKSSELMKILPDAELFTEFHVYDRFTRAYYLCNEEHKTIRS